MQDINSELKKQYHALSKIYDNVFGVFLYGSQNYGCSTQDSDVDTRAIIIPTLDDLIFSKPVSKKYKTDTGECEVKDIREMFRMFKKQNVNFLEILFTNHYYVPVVHIEEFDRIIAMREDIARYDENHNVDCIFGLFNKSYNKLFETDEAGKEIYNQKHYSNLKRLHSTMEAYVEGKPYKEVIWHPECQKLKRIRFPQQMVKEDAEVLMGNMEKMHEQFEPAAVNERTGKRMDQIVKNVIAKGITV